MVEAEANLFIGYFVTFTGRMLLFPAFGIHMTLVQNLIHAGALTIMSTCRSFALRRLFEAIRLRDGK